MEPELTTVKPSKVIFMTNVPDNLLDKRLIRQHFSTYGTVRRVSIDTESACCSVCFMTNEEAYKAFTLGTNIGNYKLKIMLGTGSGGPSLNDKTETLRDAHTYEDLDMNYLDDENDVFGTETSLEYTHSEKDLFKIKKSILRELRKEYTPKEATRKVQVTFGNDEVRLTKKAAVKGSKLLKKTSLTSMTSEELSKMGTLKKKFEILELRDKLYREKLKAAKLNVNIGTCPDMCPEKERIMRAYRKLWTSYEQKPGVNRLAPELAVKEYSRSSADQEEPLPHELRPEPVLNMAMNYLVLNIMPTIEDPDVNVSKWYDFLWDRLRGIRKDAVQQQLCSVNAAHIFEQCARFHIVCFDRLCGEEASIFDEKINTENLNNCLQTLIHMYDDLNAQGINSPNEPEFRAYEILLKLNRGDIIWEFQQLSPSLQTAPEILFALRVFSAFNNNSYSHFFKLVKKTTYLNACLLQRYFSIVRSKALKTMTSTFRRPQDQSFKIPCSYLKVNLKFDNDNDVLDFCSAHGMLLTDEGDMSMGKFDFSIPSNVSSCLSTSLNMIKDKRLDLPITIAGPAGVPLERHHKVHSSFDANLKLNKLATNAMDQVKKLEEDFGYVVKNIPPIEIDENMLTEYEKLENSKKSATEQKIFERLGVLVKDNSAPSEESKNSNKTFMWSPFEKGDGIFKTNPFPNDDGAYKTNPFKKDNETAKASAFDKGEGALSSSLFSKPSTDSNISIKTDPDEGLFKKPLIPKRFSSPPSDNTFAKSASDIFKTQNLETTSDVFKTQSSNSFLKPATVSLFAPKLVTSNQKPTESNLFSKPADGNLFQKANFNFLQSMPDNLFKKAISNISNSAKSTLLSNEPKEDIVATSSGLALGGQSQQFSANIFGIKPTEESVNNVPKAGVSIFGQPSLGANTLFNRPSSFSEFMKPGSTANDAANKTEVGKPDFKFLQKFSEIKSTSQQESANMNSGFEMSFELFVQESEQQNRKRAADDTEEERQRQREKEKQRQFELNQQKQKEFELAKQKEKELEIQRQRDMEMQRQREIEKQKQKELEEQKQREIEEERQKVLELERLRQIELEKQREWEEKIKQEIIQKKVEYDFQIAMNNLAKAQEKKQKEHEVLMMRLRKEREIRKLRKVVKKKIKYIHVRKCVRKWKDRVRRLKINKLEFPQVVLTSIENHTAVWGSIKQIKNHAPYQMTDRFETIEQLNKNPLLSTENVYLGKELAQILKENKVRPRFMKQNCQSSTPLVWKVSFHLPQLCEEYKPVGTQLSQFLRKLCHDNKHALGESNYVQVNGTTLCSSYHLAHGIDRSNLSGSDLYIFIMSELWETWEESYVRLQETIEALHDHVEVVILVYRSSYTEEDVVNYFNIDGDVNVIKWNSASDVSHLILLAFSSHFSLQHVPLYYDNLYDFLLNEVEVLFFQVKLDVDIAVCTDEMCAQFKNPNYFINIYNMLISKLYIITEPINLAPEFHILLFKGTTCSNIINENPNQLESLVKRLTLPRFKTWPVLRINKLKKLLKHFCATIDRSGRNDLFSSVMRTLNPPKESLENYLHRVNWGNILLSCFLWNLRAHANEMNNSFLFYDREKVKSELRSHWWVSMV